MALLEVTNVKKIYSTRFGGNKVQALFNVTFSVEEGEYVAIMGESGSGKTTLLNILAALDRPTSGEVLLEGKSITHLTEKEISAFRRKNLGFVFQDFNLLDTFSLRDNIYLPLVLAGEDYQEMEQKIRPIAKALHINQLLEKFPYEVSGGQKQRAAVVKTPWRSSGTPGSALSARYRVGVLLTDGRENGAAQEAVVGPDMLVHLLEEIVSRYQMGTLFAPYNRETFILFQLDEELALEERQKTLENWLRLLQNNIGQYLTGKMTIGVSQEYEELSETREQYQNAVLAAEQAFFHPERTVFFYKEALTSSAPGIFETKKFLEESWPEQFSEELERWFQVSGEQQLSVAVVKNMFQQNLRQLIQSILEEYHFEESFREKWRQEESLVSLISSAASSTELKDRALEYMQGFQEAALRAGAQNPLMEVLNYIDQHLDGKLTLPELAQMSCMSVPSFCKKFKEQTKMTVTQYINEKRVAYAATLLKQSKYSLEEVAELAGFSNANYLLRVFKKSTGKTIGQYRKQIKF